MKKKIISVLIIICLCGCFQSKSKKLDVADLVCTRSSDYLDFQDKEIITINFDSNAIITSYEEKRIITYPTIEEATTYYNKIESNDSSLDISLNESSVTIATPFVIDNDNNYYGKNKSEMKKIYTEELFYECK